jgi:transcriptional regulator with XRE-family HTH domain
MVGEDIRLGRRQRGWTQADLAEKIGISQSYVSMVERGQGGSPEIIATILRLLGIGRREPPARPEPQIRWSPPQYPIPHPLSIQMWQRPEPSGDFFLVLPLQDRHVLVAAVDVAGHRSKAVPQAIYLQGWLGGWVRGLGVPPQLGTLAEVFRSELRTTGINAAWFFAMLTLDRSTGSMSYQALSHAFPDPLLLADGRTLESTRETGPHGAEVSPLVHQLVAPPWRIVAASDGLLERLGAGNQRRGKQTLLRWQSGPARDERPASYLRTEIVPDDDEAVLIVAWSGWDEALELQVADDAERHRVVRRVRDRVEELFGSEAAVAVDEVLPEALANVQKHAYGGDGPVTVRFRREDRRFRVEVVDQGRGTAMTEGGGTKVMRRWARSVEVRRAYPSGTVVSFTIGATGDEP